MNKRPLIKCGISIRSHDWEIVYGPTKDGGKYGPHEVEWQRVRCKNCNKEIIEQPIITLKDEKKQADKGKRIGREMNHPTREFIEKAEGVAI